MPTNHSCIADLFTSHLMPSEKAEDTESSMAQARAAELKAQSLTRLFGNLMRRMIGRAPVLTQEQEFTSAVRRLHELSPHLLADIGIDPSNGALFDLELIPTPLVTPVQQPASVAAEPKPMRVRGPARPAQDFAPQPGAVSA